LALWDLNAEAGNALAAEFGSNGVFVKTDVTSSDYVHMLTGAGAVWQCPHGDQLRRYRYR
jgi:hypothetical protein